MLTRTRLLAASLFASAALSAAVPAASAQTAAQDGLVNVAVGDVTVLQDVNVGVGAALAAQVCGIDVGPVAVLGTAVDTDGVPRAVCTSAQGPVTITQN